MAELSEVRAGEGRPGRSRSSPRILARVTAAVRELGLDARRNVSMARGLKALAGFGRGASRYRRRHELGQVPRRRAAGRRRVDDGRRPRRGHAARRGARRDRERSTTSRWSAPSTRSPRWPTRPSRDGVEAIAAVGTAGLRDRGQQRRPPRCRARARGRRGRGHLRRGGGAARLPRRIRPGLARGSLVVFDTGGGSSQFTFGRRRQVDERFSVNVGAARFTERFGLDGAVSDETLALGARRDRRRARAPRRPAAPRRSSAWAAP